MLRTYTELAMFDTIEDRFRYLQLNGAVGWETFGHGRWMNQRFYASREWKLVRNEVLVRDNGMDLGVEGYEIYDKAYIHHMNPMTPDDFIHHSEDILNPEFLISCTLQTHNAIHYGDVRQLPRPYKARVPGDTKLW